MSFSDIWTPDALALRCQAMNSAKIWARGCGQITLTPEYSHSPPQMMLDLQPFCIRLPCSKLSNLAARFNAACTAAFATVAFEFICAGALEERAAWDKSVLLSKAKPKALTTIAVTKNLESCRFPNNL